MHLGYVYCCEPILFSHNQILYLQVRHKKMAYGGKVTTQRTKQLQSTFHEFVRNSVLTTPFLNYSMEGTCTILGCNVK